MKFVLLTVLAITASTTAGFAQAASRRNPPPIPTVKANPATILSVKMVAFRHPDPAVKKELIDIFAVTVQNNGNKNFVRAILEAGKNGVPNEWPAVMDGTDNLKFVGAKPPVWQVPLAPLQTKTIYFVARSTDANSYCVGVNNAVWQCTS